MGRLRALLRPRLDNLKLWRASRSKAYCFPPWTPSLHTLTRFAQRHSGAKRVVMSSSTATSKAPRCLAGYHPSGVVYGLKLVWLSLYFLSDHARVPLQRVTAGPFQLNYLIYSDKTRFFRMFELCQDSVNYLKDCVTRRICFRCDGTLGLRLDSVPQLAQVDAGLVCPVEINEDSDNGFNNHLEGRLEWTDYLDLLFDAFNQLVRSLDTVNHLPLRRTAAVMTGYDDDLVSSSRLARLPEGSSGLRRWLALLATPFWCGVLTRESDKLERILNGVLFDLHYTLCFHSVELTTFSFRVAAINSFKCALVCIKTGSYEADLGFHLCVFFSRVLIGCFADSEELLHL
ncbi:hypothetical protein BDZ89DRAFT_1141779 [Hymenopellis radicata]|nr:hypothetical protein BDZ89DRAFT_1141779 [Hymenopellis radicata]